MTHAIGGVDAVEHAENLIGLLRFLWAERGAVGKNDQVHAYFVTGKSAVGQIRELSRAGDPGRSGREIVRRISVDFELLG